MEVDEAPPSLNEETVSTTVSKTEEKGADIVLVDLSWLPDYFNLLTISDDYIVGFVKTQEDLEKLTWVHSWNTKSSFLHGWVSKIDHRKRSKDHPRIFTNFNYKDLSPQVYMYTIDNVTTKICQFGGAYKPKKPKKDITPKSGTRMGTTKHVNCPARIALRYITMYTEYPIEEFSRRERRKLAIKLKERIENQSPNIKKEMFIHVSLPLRNAHCNHIVNKKTMYQNKTHPEVLRKIEELVSLGMHTINNIKPLLYNYSKTILCPQLGIEPDLELEYLFPKSKSIGNQLNRSKRKFDIPRKKINPPGFSKRYQRRMAKKGIGLVVNSNKSPIKGKRVIVATER